MTEAIVVVCACGNEAEALQIGRTLVEERLAACANVLGRVQSIYRWQGEVEAADEHMLLIKTTKARLKPLRDRITELHSYDTPEVIAIPILDGAEKYLAWIRENV
ncbi:MAG: divalent-cation tolerance protein CutA [Acidobacteriota bacterium]|nr:divalent-cation tolerance protein CutA [Acidobacteriota bacterium]